jgi:hypothetical protein
MIELFTIFTFLFALVLTVFCDVAFVIVYGADSIHISFVSVPAISGLMALVPTYVTGIYICIEATFVTATSSRWSII